jgi:hypothetical protein
MSDTRAAASCSRLGEALVIGLITGNMAAPSAVSPESVTELWRWANANKVVPQLALALGGSDLGHEPRIRAWRQRLSNAMSEIARAARSRNLKVAVSKGFCFEKAYPSNQYRQFEDIDLQVFDLGGFWTLHQILDRLNFKIDNLVLRSTAGQFSGAALYEQCAADEHGCRLSVDVQIAAVPIGWKRSYPFEEDYWTSLRCSIDGIFMPDDAWAAVMLIAEACENKTVPLRDALDLFFVLRRLDSSDLDRLDYEMRAHDLHAGLTRLSRRALRAGLPIHECESRVATLALEAANGRHVGRLNGVIPGWSRPSLNRFLRLLDGAGAIPSFAKPMIAREIDFVQTLRSGDPLKFVPIAGDPCGALGWWNIGQTHLLRTPIGCFLPTPFGEVGAQDMVEAAHICFVIAEERTR